MCVCYEGKYTHPQNSDVETLTPSVIIAGSGDFGR